MQGFAEKTEVPNVSKVEEQPSQAAQNREDAESTDQVAAETSADQESQQAAPKHSGYVDRPPPPPPAPLAAPPRQHPNGRHPPPPHGKPQFNHKHNGGVQYHGPPPPPPPPAPKAPAAPQPEAMDKSGYGPPPPPPPPLLAPAADPWPNAVVADTPKIVSLDVKCEKNSMKVFISFDKPFFGIVFSKGHYSNVNCVHLPAGLGRTSANFEIGIHACGTSGNTENGLYGYGADAGSGTYFENIIVIQYDPQVQEVWDQARKLRCTWHDQYEKSVTFRPFPVDMLDVVRADFAGDNVGCWMQIQVGKGPWASEVSGLVKIGQTMTMVLAIKDDDSKFDMLVRNCMAHDGKRAPIQLVDQRGCVTRSKLMSRFTKIKNFGASASVLSYAHFQAFKFPDSMEVHFQCTIQICRYQCPDQCSSDSGDLIHPQHTQLLEAHHSSSNVEATYGNQLPIDVFLHGGSGGQPRDERRVRRHRRDTGEKEDIGVNKIIKVVSTGDLTFALDDSNSTSQTMIFPTNVEDNSGMICMTTIGFSATLFVLLGILVVSCLVSACLCIRLRPFSNKASQKTVSVSYTNPILAVKKTSKSSFYTSS